MVSNELSLNMPDLSQIFGECDQNNFQRVNNAVSITVKDTKPVDLNYQTLTFPTNNSHAGEGVFMEQYCSPTAKLAADIKPKPQDMEMMSNKVSLNIPDLPQIFSDYEQRLNNVVSMSVKDTKLNEFSYETLAFCTNRFNTTNLLGEGGFGTVFLGENLSPRIKLAAVKKLDAIKYKDQKYQEKFRRELRILSKYSHENIVEILGFSRNGPELCLVYEFIENGNLEQKLESCRSGQVIYEWEKRQEIILGIAEGIKFLHQVNVIHRDIKSANILLQGNTAKLCDFGLLKLSTSETPTGILGTLPYLAPEGVRGDVSPLLDVFAFGIVIMETVTGLKVIDKTRKPRERDLARFVYQQEDELHPLVDMTAGQNGRWIYNGVQLLKIALDCYAEKRNRPDIFSIYDRIKESLQNKL